MSKRARTWISLALILALACATGLVGFLRWRRSEIFVATDDAYVKGHVVAIASRVAGSILTLDLQENQEVHAGQVIAAHQIEHTQYYPRPGWVEHDGREIWATQAGVAAEALARDPLSVLLDYEAPLDREVAAGLRRCGKPQYQ